MSETIIEKPKISALITASVLAGIFSILILIIRANFYRPWWSEYFARNLELLFGMSVLITGYLSVKKINGRKRYFTLGIIILFLFFQMLLNFIISPYQQSLLYSCIGLASIACLVCLLLFPVINSMNRWVYGIKGNLKYDMFAYSGITIGLFICGIWLMETCGPIQTSWGMGCSNNLERLGNAIRIYHNENQGQYPESNKWCDLLLNYGQIKQDDFICPEIKFRWKRQVLPWPIPKNKRCYYAMNPNCEPNSPANTVLLFETKGGWNLSGGAELLSTENHGRLCNVLLNNGRVEFLYKPEQFKDLKWK